MALVHSLANATAPRQHPMAEHPQPSIVPITPDVTSVSTNLPSTATTHMPSSANLQARFLVRPLQFTGSVNPGARQKVELFIRRLQKLKQQDIYGVIKTIRPERIRETLMPFAEQYFKNDPSQITSMVIGVSGGSASGKSFLAEKFMDAMESHNPAKQRFGLSGYKANPVISVFPLDAFYHDTAKARQQLHTDADGDRAYFNTVNLDSPKSINLEKAAAMLAQVKAGQNIRIPYNNFPTSESYLNAITAYATPYIVVDGLYTFMNKDIDKQLNLKLYIDTDEPIREERWLARAEERGVLDSPLDYYQIVKSIHSSQVQPQEAEAGIVLNGGVDISQSQPIITEISEILHTLFTPIPVRVDEKAQRDVAKLKKLDLVFNQ